MRYSHRTPYTLACLLILLFGVSWDGLGVPRGPDQRQRRQPHRPGEILIRPVTGLAVQTLAVRYGVTIIDQLPDLGIWRLRVPAGRSENAILDSMATDPNIDFSDLNYLLTNPEAQQQSFAFVDSTAPPFVQGSSPANYFTQEAYEQIRALPAWIYTTGQNVKVAVIDTGIDRTHPALSGHIRILPGSDIVDHDNDPEDESGGSASGHGTFVSGLIARMAPNAQILPIRALNRDGIGEAYNVARALVYAAKPPVGAQVINLSLGLTVRSSVIDAALDFAWRAGALPIAAAGNNNSEEAEYIASHPDVLSVAAVDHGDIRAGFSNYGTYVSVTSPGVNLYSTFLNNQFAFWSGTSFATALVSGQAALLKAFRPELLPRDLIALIRATADNIDGLNSLYVGRLGSGRINAMAAVIRARDP